MNFLKADLNKKVVSKPINMIKAAQQTEKIEISHHEVESLHHDQIA